MDHLTHNEKDINISGTHLRGCVMTTYDKLIKSFGQPKKGDGYKVDVEWAVEFPDGTIATVYNWKNGPAYCGDEFEVEYINEWNVGGNSDKCAELIKEILSTA